MSSADVEEFSASLSDLTVNSKPHINMLTMLAEDYIAQAPAIVKAVEDQLKHVSGNVKLPVLYLIDSIVKNVGKNYITLFGQNIVNTFTQAFEMVDEKARSQMYKLRQTWQIVFPQGKMYALDLKVNSIDPAWPITTPTTSTSIHLNPKFLTDPPATQILSQAFPGEKNQQDFLKQKKELLELQKRKVELELMQTKAILEEQTKKTTVPSSIVGNLIGLVSKQTISPISGVPISAKTDTVSASVVKPTVANAALVAPVRIRDPRLRIKEGASKDTIPAAQVRKAVDQVVPPKSTTLSNASNGQQASLDAVTSSSSSSPKRDKKKKSKESKSRKEEVQLPTTKSRERSKLSRAEQVLENLKEEQRLTKIQNLGSDTVINKAKQHEQSKLKEAKPVSPKRPSKPPSPKREVPPKITNLLPPIKSAEVASSVTSSSPVSPKKAERPALPPEPEIQSTSKPKDESTITVPKIPSVKEILAHASKTIKTTTPEPEPSKSIAPSREKTPEPPPAPKISLTVPDDAGIPPKTISDRLVSSSVRLEEHPSPSKRSSQKSSRKSKTPSPLPKSTRERRSSKRKRDRSSTPEESPKKPASGPLTQEMLDLPVTTPLLPEPEALIGSGHDTDLRLLTAKPPIEESPSKKAKTDNLDELFGKEDVDLRALPPPAPIISRPSPPSSPIPGSQSPERNKNWANLKRSNSEISLDSVKRTPLKPLERRRSDRFTKQNDDLDEELSLDDPANEERAKERIEMLVKNAEEQVSNGNITFAQYNSMLKEVLTMNEKRKLKEAMKRDLDAEVGFSPDRSPGHDDLTNDHEPSHKRRRKHGDSDDVHVHEDEHSKDRDFGYREDHRRRDNSREKRFSSRERSQRFEPNRGHPQFPGHQPQMRGGFRTRDKFGRWIPTMGPGRPQFEPNFPYRPQMINYRNMGPGNREVPPADPAVLDMIAKDPMKTINIDGIPREIRFYGETAVIMMAFDDPKEVSFQPGQRRVTFNDQETISLVFNSPYQEVFIDGIPCQVRFGAPTREIYINGVFYEAIFGGPPIQVLIGNQVHSVRLHGPLPHVKISTESRKDLVAGKVSLIVDGNDIVPIYLDAKPQRFDIGGIPYILRFVEALQTVVINGVPFKIEFGSNLPVPMYFHGEKHYLRFTALPNGIRPGYITIINMEGGRLPSPSPPLLPQPQSTVPAASAVEPMPDQENLLAVRTQLPHAQHQPLELLATMMPSAGFNPGIGQSYTVEEDSNHPPDSTTVPSGITADLASINVGELLKKLVAVGIVPATSSNEPGNTSSEIVPVSFNNTESLKTKQPGLVHALYSGMQCSSCGVRFPPEQTGKYSQHLDWHFRQNRRGKDAVRVAQSRRWCYEVSDWIQYQEIEEKEDRAPSWFEIQEKRHSESEDVVEDEPSVPAGEKCENAFCKICLDVFDQFYNEEKEEWHLKRAIEVDGKLYHPLCHKDREEKRLAMEAAPSTLAKSTLIVPTEEPELIEIPDDATVDETAVLTMPIDNEADRVETIDLDSEPSSNSKDGQQEEAVKTEASPDEAEESDDDILGIEVLETKIETYELSDEEGGGKEDDNDERMSEHDDSAVDEKEKEVDLSKVKKEKVDVVDLDLATTQPFVVSSIDGNVELEDAAPVSLPRNIKINIASAIIPSKSTAPVVVEPTREESPPIEPIPTSHHSTEPPPPGEELIPQTVKSRLSQVDLKVLPPVEKGSELSGLCSIM